jgi:hypothetical protein
MEICNLVSIRVFYSNAYHSQYSYSNDEMAQSISIYQTDTQTFKHNFY